MSKVLTWSGFTVATPPPWGDGHILLLLFRERLVFTRLSDFVKAPGCEHGFQKVGVWGVAPPLPWGDGHILLLLFRERLVFTRLSGFVKAPGWEHGFQKVGIWGVWSHRPGTVPGAGGVYQTL